MTTLRSPFATAGTAATPSAQTGSISKSKPFTSRRLALVVGSVVLLWFALYNLTRFPATWFDEGSHLHVPKTLVTFGRYADYSDGEFRYYGPTVGVGPTVMLPIAAAFKVAGVGLVQARLVMGVYLVLAVLAFVALARSLGGVGPTAFAVLLLATSPTIGLFENGRQVLGEVPGLFFLCSGLVWWFSCWDKPTWTKLLGASAMLALASITKHVYLISIFPGLVAAGGLNLLYYRQVAHRVFLTPLVAVGAVFGAWQLILVAGLGPSTALENLRLLQDATRGAALVFSTENMRRAAGELLSVRAASGLVLPALISGGARQFSRDRNEQRWGAIWWMAVANLVWFVLASAGWPRYAFPGLTLSCLLVGRLAWGLMQAPDRNAAAVSVWAGGGAIALWIVMLSVGFLGRTTLEIMRAPFPASQRMADYLQAHVATNRVIHTWEPEMSILSDHRYRFPPPRLLIVAVAHQWTGGPPVTQTFDFETNGRPDYVLEGPFSRYVKLYPQDRLARDYRPVLIEGGYVLYERLVETNKER